MSVMPSPRARLATSLPTYNKNNKNNRSNNNHNNDNNNNDDDDNQNACQPGLGAWEREPDLVRQNSSPTYTSQGCTVWVLLNGCNTTM